MFLSKIFVENNSRNNAYQTHQKLWALFPSQADAGRSFLFRVETQQPGIGSELLMQSTSKPTAAKGVNILGQKKFQPAFTSGQRLRFRVRANPVKTIKDPSKGSVTKNGETFTRTVRVPLIHEEERREWLIRKFQGVASLESLIIQSEKALYFRKVKEQRSGKIQPVMFEGVLEVIETEAFQNILSVGIGPAKAFGCGLLSLAAA